MHFVCSRRIIITNVRDEQDKLVREAAAAIRGSVSELARRISVSRRGIADWQAGAREMPGPVRILLRIVIAHPELLPAQAKEDAA